MGCHFLLHGIFLTQGSNSLCLLHWQEDSLLIHHLGSPFAFGNEFTYLGTSLVAQTVKRLPTMWETWVRSLGREDPVEEKMATHSSLLAWEIPQTEEPGRLQSMGLQRGGHDLK